MKLAEAINTALLASTPVTTIVGAASAAKIYPGIAPSGTVAPYVVWQELPSAPDNTLGEAAGSAQRSIQFSCIADTYSGAVDLANAIATTLDNSTLGNGAVCMSVFSHDGYSEVTDQFVRVVGATIFSTPDS